MLVLFDHGTPKGLARALSEHTVHTAQSRGWDTLSNGELLNAAEQAGFDLLLTTDRRIRYQQNPQCASHRLRRPDGQHPVLSRDGAYVMVIDLGEQKFTTPDEFLEDRRRELARGTQRQRVKEFDATLDSSLGATCVRARQLTEMTGLRAFGGSAAMHLTHRLYCLHPRWPQYLINIIYSQQYRLGGLPLALDSEADMFLKSVAFTASRPVALPE